MLNVFLCYPAGPTVHYTPSDAMTSIKFLTWNVRGVRNKIKRTAALAYLKAQKANIMALTETHVTGHLQAALKRPWIGWAYHSTHTSFSRGVSLLVTKATPFELLLLESDQQGKYVFVHARVGGINMLLIVCYIPPPYSSEVITMGFAFMAKHPTVPAVWMGDFNMTMDPFMDRPTRAGGDPGGAQTKQAGPPGEGIRPDGRMEAKKPRD